MPDPLERLRGNRPPVTRFARLTPSDDLPNHDDFKTSGWREQAIRQLHAAGWPVEDVARLSNLPVAEVEHVLAGGCLGKKSRRRGTSGKFGTRILTGQQIEEARRLRQQGWLLRVIAERFGVSTSTVSVLLKKHPPRPENGAGAGVVPGFPWCRPRKAG